MASISNTARRSTLPRRTVQYWYDHKAVEPGEIEIVRLLRPFAHMGAPIGVIKVVAIALRDSLLKGDGQHAVVVNAARAGKPAYLAVKIIPTPGRAQEGEFGSYLPDLFSTCSRKVLAEHVASAMKITPALPLVMVNLTEALSTERILEAGDDDDR